MRPGQVPSDQADSDKRARGPRIWFARPRPRVGVWRGRGDDMSLVGNLEDLSLGDILQIISLSQKSGVLVLESDQGSGRVVFDAGLVKGACVKGGVCDLRGLLVGGGLLDPAGFDAAKARATDEAADLQQILAQETGLDGERLDSLVRETLEKAIFEMFSWSSGDFSFDVRSEPDPSDPELLLPGGVNAQYLAMEGLRLSDERARDEVGEDSAELQAVPAPQAEALSVDAPFGNEPLEIDEAPVGELLDALPVELDEGGTGADVLVATVLGDEREEAEAIEAGPEPSKATTPTKRMTAVLIDPDVTVLEWVKSAIQADFRRVHVFQQAEQGLSRIRQYLIRGELPLVLISLDAPIDPLSGIHGLGDFVKRLKSQAPRLVVLGLCSETRADAAPSPLPRAFDALLRCPAALQLRERSAEQDSRSAEALARALQQALSQLAAPATSVAAPDASGGAASLRALRDATARLQGASSRGEVLPVVLDYASQFFTRVAILAVRDEEVFAIAGRGIDSLEVDPLDPPPEVSLRTLDPGWIRDVIETCELVVAPPRTEADRMLLDRFGGLEPEQVFLAPIESDGVVMALLYGDQAGAGGAPPDTSGLEVVLHHAATSLDRAALERALWEADGGVS